VDEESNDKYATHNELRRDIVAVKTDVAVLNQKLQSYADNEAAFQKRVGQAEIRIERSLNQQLRHIAEIKVEIAGQQGWINILKAAGIAAWGLFAAGLAALARWWVGSDG